MPPKTFPGFADEPSVRRAELRSGQVARVDPMAPVTEWRNEGFDHGESQGRPCSKLVSQLTLYGGSVNFGFFFTLEAVSLLLRNGPL